MFLYFNLFLFDFIFLSFVRSIQFSTSNACIEKLKYTNACWLYSFKNTNPQTPDQFPVETSYTIYIHVPFVIPVNVILATAHSFWFKFRSSLFNIIIWKWNDIFIYICRFWRKEKKKEKKIMEWLMTLFEIWNKLRIRFNFCFCWNFTRNQTHSLNTSIKWNKWFSSDFQLRS